MVSVLPINLDDLINARAVETVRREFKKTWSQPTLDQSIRSICAFANDFFNLNGGYIVIGIEEQNGLPILPPHGLEDQDVDEIQKQIRGNCKNIDPEYQPVLSPEYYMEKLILVIWVLGGELRPYQAPKGQKDRERAYYVRQGSETVEARGDILTQLMQMAARVPFDDRRNLYTSIDVLSPTLVRNFLSDIKSDLVAAEVQVSDYDLYRNLRISVKVNGYEAPRNIALMFFVNNPEDYFSGARIEVVQFGDDAGGDLIEEKVFRGPLHIQIRQVLNYLDSFSTTLIKKIPNQAEVSRTVAFPYEAMEEAIVNAIYHRDYELPEPVKVYLYPNRMEIISYPGPVMGLERKHFQLGNPIPPVPVRNRRIGEFLKELRLAEGRGTGIPKIRRKMNENGSPEPVFEFDEARSYFQVILPAHPQYIVIQALRESAHLWAIGERQKAISNLENASKAVSKSGALIAQIIEYTASIGDLTGAERVFNDIQGDYAVADRHLPYIAIAKIFLDNGNLPRALAVLADTPYPTRMEEIIEFAVLYKRSERYKDAHRIFADNYDFIKDNPKAIHEYAQTKIKLAQLTRNDSNTRRRLNRESAELLRRTIQLSDDNTRSAWAWFDLARVLNWLGSSETDITQAYTKAMELLPNESRFRESYSNWRKNRSLD